MLNTPLGQMVKRMKTLNVWLYRWLKSSPPTERQVPETEVLQAPQLGHSPCVINTLVKTALGQHPLETLSLSKQNARHWDLPGIYQRGTDISDFHWNCRSCSQEHNFRISTHISWRKQTTRVCKCYPHTYPVRYHLVQQPSNSRVYMSSTFIFASPASGLPTAARFTREDKTSTTKKTHHNA